MTTRRVQGNYWVFGLRPSSCILEIALRYSRNPVILSVVHRRQNPLESTRYKRVKVCLVGSLTVRQKHDVSRARYGCARLSVSGMAVKQPPDLTVTVM
jgi:hypothetical protein